MELDCPAGALEDAAQLEDMAQLDDAAPLDVAIAELDGEGIGTLEDAIALLTAMDENAIAEDEGLEPADDDMPALLPIMELEGLTPADEDMPMLRAIIELEIRAIIELEIPTTADELVPMLLAIRELERPTPAEDVVDIPPAAELENRLDLTRALLASPRAEVLLRLDFRKHPPLLTPRYVTN